MKYTNDQEKLCPAGQRPDAPVDSLHAKDAAMGKERVIQHIPHWVRKGLIVKYLPAYAPELNLIEILWRFIKYYWLPFSAYTSFQCLCQAVEDILTRFGTDDTINFQAS